MNRKLNKKKVIIMLLLIVIFLNNYINISSAYLKIGDSTRIYKDKELLGLVQYKSTGALRLIIRAYYIKPNTNERKEAFCIEPDKEGVRYRSRR